MTTATGAVALQFGDNYQRQSGGEAPHSKKIGVSTLVILVTLATLCTFDDFLPK
jgi:hypothetical protein